MRDEPDMSEHEARRIYRRGLARLSTTLRARKRPVALAGSVASQKPSDVIRVHDR